MHDRTVVPVNGMAEIDGVLENCLMQWVDVSVALWQRCCRADGCWKRERHGRRRPDGLVCTGWGGWAADFLR